MSNKQCLELLKFLNSLRINEKFNLMTMYLLAGADDSIAITTEILYRGGYIKEPKGKMLVSQKLKNIPEDKKFVDNIVSEVNKFLKDCNNDEGYKEGRKKIDTIVSNINNISINSLNN